MEGSPIRVMFVVPCLSMGGAERHVVTLLPRMDPARFAPSVLCIGEEGEFFPQLRKAGIPGKALHLGGQKNAFRALGKLIVEMRRLKPDAVIVRGYSAEALGRIAAVLVGVRTIIVWIHDLGDITRRSSVRQLSDRLLRRRTSAFFGVAFAQIPYMRDVLGIPQARIRIIHNGIDLAQFPRVPEWRALEDWGVQRGVPVVGIVAGLRPEKDHKTFLRAAKIVSSRMPAAQFLIIGDGSLRAELEALAATLGIAASVHFVGFRDDISKFVGALDVFTLCSRTECFPFALIEAMACSVPPVCTDVGGISEAIDEGVSGYLVARGDSEALADRMLALLHDRPLAREMGNAAKRRVESNFTLEESVKGAQRAIQAVVDADRAIQGNSLARRLLAARSSSGEG